MTGPVPLVTYDDARTAWQAAGIGTPEGWRAGLEAVAPAMRDRWLAEFFADVAGYEIAGRLYEPRDVTIVRIETAAPARNEAQT